MLTRGHSRAAMPLPPLGQSTSEIEDEEAIEEEVEKDESPKCRREKHTSRAEIMPVPAAGARLSMEEGAEAVMFATSMLARAKKAPARAAPPLPRSKPASNPHKAFASTATPETPSSLATPAAVPGTPGFDDADAIVPGSPPGYSKPRKSQRRGTVWGGGSSSTYVRGTYS